jgi:hypothetical protein
MSKPVHYIPDGYHTVTPYLIVKGAASALEFYQKAFGAEELFRMPQPAVPISGRKLLPQSRSHFTVDSPCCTLRLRNAK